jgi:SAM-dependent methyltransferase
MAEFDKRYWEDHWEPDSASVKRLPANPYLAAETVRLPVGTALDAGCGVGTEALWLAAHGWQVTGADISARALAAAQARAADAGIDAPIEWVEADLARWEPGRTWDLVVTNYAHADIGQLAFYQRLSSWVSPGGTLLIVGHLHDHDDNDRGAHDHPEGATATLSMITHLFRDPDWRIETGYENTRTVHAGGHAVQLHDVIVRAHRLS